MRLSKEKQDGVDYLIISICKTLPRAFNSLEEVQ